MIVQGNDFVECIMYGKCFVCLMILFDSLLMSTMIDITSMLLFHDLP